MTTFNSLYYDGLLIFSDDGETVTLKIDETEEYHITDKKEYEYMLNMLQNDEYDSVRENDIMTFSEKVIRLHEKREKKNAAR